MLVYSILSWRGSIVFVIVESRECLILMAVYGYQCLMLSSLGALFGMRIDIQSWSD